MNWRFKLSMRLAQDSSLAETEQAAQPPTPFSFPSALDRWSCGPTQVRPGSRVSRVLAQATVAMGATNPAPAAQLDRVQAGRLMLRP